MELRPAPSITFGTLIEFEDGQWVHLDTELPIGLVHRLSSLAGLGETEVSDDACSALTEIIVDWQVLRRGEVLPKTAEAIRDTPTCIIIEIAKTIREATSHPLARRR